MRCAWIVGLCLAVGACAVAGAAEQTWEVRGEFIGLKPGAADVALIRLPGGSQIEVPLASLSADSRATVEKRAGGKPRAADGADAAKPADGKAARPAVAEALKGVEADALACRTAAEAVLVYRLYLAAEDVSQEDREAAQERLGHWRGLAAAGKVRLGSDWVAREAADKAAAEADSIMVNAFELIRLGNTKLAWDELQKAGRADPESGRAAFVTGLIQAVGGQDEAKALDSFAEAVRREPDNPAALNNLAVCEVRNRRQSAAVMHFRQAVERMPDAQPVVDNVGFTIRSAGALRPKMSDKVLAEFNDLYKSFPREWKSSPTQSLNYALLAPRCRPFTAGLQSTEIEDVAAALAAGFGFFVAPGRIVVGAKLVAGAREIAVRDPANRLSMQPATVVAAQESPAIALLKCDAIQGKALPLATSLPDVGGNVTAMGRAVGAAMALGPTAVPGTVQTGGEQDLGGNAFLAAAVARGFGGGPVVDDAGRVVGMIAATPRTDASGMTRTICIPVELLRPFLQKHLRDAALGEEAGADGVRAALAGTVLVTVTKKPAGAAR